MTIECVPNFSEGRDRNIIAALENSAGSLLLDSTSDFDHNRTVLTFAGKPNDVAEAAFAAVRTAALLIDLTAHEGVHPRLGAADVVPFVPIEGVTMEKCAELARETGKRIWEELQVPVYFYESAALREECRRLENVRRLARGGLKPDIGVRPHPTAGCCVVGARKFLIAWNINLKTTDLSVAQAIAREIRESSGGLPAVKAIGLPLESREETQVSINLVDFEKTPLHTVFEAVASLCKKRGVTIAGSELIGMIPSAALKRSEGNDFQWINFHPDLVLENRLK